MEDTPVPWRGLVREAREAARRGDPLGIEVLVDALAWRDAVARRSAVEKLVALGPLAAPWVLHSLSSARGEEREAFLEVLRRYHFPPLLALLGMALDDPSPSRRRAAILALGSSEDTRAIPLLRWALRNERDGAIRALAVEGLAVYNGARGGGPVRLALSDPRPAVRRAAAEALGRNHTFLAIPALMRAARDPNPAVARAAKHALAALGVPLG